MSYYRVAEDSLLKWWLVWEMSSRHDLLTWTFCVSMCKEVECLPRPPHTITYLLALHSLCTDRFLHILGNSCFKLQIGYEVSEVWSSILMPLGHHCWWYWYSSDSVSSKQPVYNIYHNVSLPVVITVVISDYLCTQLRAIIAVNTCQLSSVYFSSQSYIIQNYLLTMASIYRSLAVREWIFTWNGFVNPAWHCSTAGVCKHYL